MKPEKVCLEFPDNALSHPAGVRGLKRGLPRQRQVANPVAPRRGAWVETCLLEHFQNHTWGRTPQGCVG